MKTETKEYINQLSAYLGFNLKMTRNGFIGELLSIETNGNMKVSCSNWFENVSDKNPYKPILRPFTDLLKEIDFEGKKITPIAYLNNLPGFATLVRVGYENKKYFCVMAINDELIRYDYPRDFLSWKYADFAKLLKMRFDVFGLIEKGLAIDINTLEHECKR